MTYFELPEGSEKTKVASGCVTLSTSGMTKVVTGFKPKYLALTQGRTNTVSGNTLMMVYNENYSTTKFKFSSASVYSSDVSLGGSTGNRLYSIDNDGFTITKSGDGRAEDYFAIG